MGWAGLPFWEGIQIQGEGACSRDGAATWGFPCALAAAWGLRSARPWPPPEDSPVPAWVEQSWEHPPPPLSAPLLQPLPLPQKCPFSTSSRRGPHFLLRTSWPPAPVTPVPLHL